MAAIDPVVQGARAPHGQAPRAVARQRLVERAGTPDRTMLLTAGLVAAVLAGTAVFRDAWALLPLITLAGAMPTRNVPS